jgi:ApbE superfamily uncharacterized protein (UPF0280 family)
MSGRLPKKGITHDNVSGTSGLTRCTYQIGETQGVIITDYPPALDVALTAIHEQREILIRYMNSNPHFENSLEPVEIMEDPEIIHLMSSAGKVAGVGPMAAVAGVIADLTAKKMIEQGTKVAVVENGGEAALHSDRALMISVGAGDNYLTNRIGFKVTDFPCGVATSSGRHSHAFSKGDADSVTVFAENAGIADAVATAAANNVIGEPGYDVKAGVETALSIEGVHGVLVIRDEQVSIGGRLPQIISIEVSEN